MGLIALTNFLDPLIAQIPEHAYKPIQPIALCSSGLGEAYDLGAMTGEGQGDLGDVVFSIEVQGFS